MGLILYTVAGWCGAVFYLCAEHWVDNTVKAFVLLTPPHHHRGWGSTRSWKEIQPGHLTPTDPSDIPDHVASCLDYQAEGRKEEVRHILNYIVCLPKSPLHILKLYFLSPLPCLVNLGLCLDLVPLSELDPEPLPVDWCCSPASAFHYTQGFRQCPRKLSWYPAWCQALPWTGCRGAPDITND